jgi:hypothetical protein
MPECTENRGKRYRTVNGVAGASPPLLRSSLQGGGILLEYATGTNFGIDREIKTLVVFDNNAYGDLMEGVALTDVRPAVGRLVLQERAADIQAIASPYVMLECAALLADPSKRAHDRAWSNTLALTEHCSVYTAEGRILGLMEDMESQICRMLYDRVPPEIAASVDRVSSLLEYTSESVDRSRLDAVRGDFQEIADRVEAAEQAFVDDVRRHVVEAVNPAATDWNPLKSNPDLRRAALGFLRSPEAVIGFAKMHVLKANLHLGIVDSPAEIEEKAKWVAERFRTPAMIYVEILTRIFSTGFNVSKAKNANSLWDIYIAFSTGAAHAIGGRPVLLVTGDDMVLKAAKAASARDHVLTLDEYRALLAKHAP